MHAADGKIAMGNTGSDNFAMSEDMKEIADDFHYSADLNLSLIHILPIAAKIGSQKHLVAIRDGFIGIMPITMAGAVATLLNVFFRDLPNNYLPDWHIAETFQWLIGINGNVWWGTLAMLAIAFAFSFGYHLAKACLLYTSRCV